MAGLRDGLPVVEPASAAELEAWLDEHHASADGAWLKLAKAGSGRAGPTRREVVEALLCFGWIDGQGRSLDETHWLQRITPRRPRSRWSKVNREYVAELTTAGRMRPAGLAEVERARADGRWDAAYEPPSRATVPDDLQAGLDASPTAAEAFSALDSRNRYAILHRIAEAKKPETRARRIAKFVAMLEAGDKPYP